MPFMVLPIGQNGYLLKNFYSVALACQTVRISFADDFMTGCFFFVAEDNSHPHSFTYSVYISDYPTCALKGCTVIEKCNTESESPLSSNSSEFLTTLACTSTIPKNCPLNTCTCQKVDSFGLSRCSCLSDLVIGRNISRLPSGFLLPLWSQSCVIWIMETEKPLQTFMLNKYFLNTSSASWVTFYFLCHDNVMPMSLFFLFEQIQTTCLLTVAKGMEI